MTNPQDEVTPTPSDIEVLGTRLPFPPGTAFPAVKKLGLERGELAELPAWLVPAAFPCLGDLYLSGNPGLRDAVSGLTAHGPWPKLKELYLENTGLRGPQDWITPAAFPCLWTFSLLSNPGVAPPSGPPLTTVDRVELFGGTLFAVHN